MRRFGGRTYLACLVVSLSLLLLGIAVELKGSQPQQQRFEPPRLVDPDFRPEQGTYRYAFRFNGLGIGSAWVRLEQSSGRYVIQFRARTSSAIDRIYPVRYSGRNITEMDELSPVGTRIISRVRSTSKDTSIHFGSDGTITSVRTESKKNGPLENEVRKIQAESYTADPLSVIHLLRGIDWRPGMDQSVQVFTGKSRYATRFACTGEKVVEVGGEKRRAWEIVQESRKLDDQEEETEEKRKERNLLIYLSADEARDVLMIDARRAMGHFLVVMEGFEPAEQKDRTSTGSARRN
ncbi:MAG: DUF3108 domain-containing protein [Desulfomonilia bacterium]|jgi:hypothetical protein